MNLRITSVDITVRDTLIPNAQNTELKSLLENALKIFVDHHGRRKAGKAASAASQG